MPAQDLTQLVHSAIEKNSGIPAMLDAYGEFAVSPIGPLELEDLGGIFNAILGNLKERYPQIASTKAAANAKNDVVSFLASANNNADRVKSVLAEELRPTDKFMAASLAERFSRASPEEKRAVDATLRLIRRSGEDIIFRAEVGKGIETSGAEFERFFASVKAEAPATKELRFQNLIVEKGLFDKLILKTRDRRDNAIWVPSFFAKENVDLLLQKLALPSEHILYSRLQELKQQGKLDAAIRSVLTNFLQSDGVLTQGGELPSELEDFAKMIGKYVVLAPLELDDVSRFFEEEEETERQVRREAEEKQRALEVQERSRIQEQELARQEQQQKRRSLIQVPVAEPERKKSGESIYLGRNLDLEQLVSALNRRAPEKEIETQVKTVGEYFVNLSEIKQAGVAIVGSSGSGRSTTLRRLLDGLASATSNSSPESRIILIDQKGEHRGIAWKYKWNVLAFAQDVQSRQFRLPSFLNLKGGEDEANGSELAASLLQEWLLQAGVSCTDQQRARIASIIRANSGSTEAVSRGLLSEPELAPVAQKLVKNILSKSTMARIFDETSPNVDIGGTGSVIFDVSGRGLRDPTTKEERLLASVLILKYLVEADLRSAIVVLEDLLDRFKSENLRNKVKQYAMNLRQKGCTIVATSRSQIRDFVGDSALEILHRLSGEKVVAEELSGFKTSRPIKNFPVIVTFLPRGYAFASSMTTTQGEKIPTSALKIEPLQFSTAVT